MNDLTNAPERGIFRSLRYRLAFLIYLILYPIPWYYDGVSNAHVLLSGIGISVFLVIYLILPPQRMPAVRGIMFALTGFGLAWCDGIWTVFIVYSATSFCLVRPRKRAFMLAGALLAILAAFCWITHKEWADFVFGAVFSSATFFASLLQIELAERNAQLLEAQDELRYLATVAERERIARDMHDLLGHSLTVIAVKAELAQRLGPQEPDRAISEAAEIAEIARRSLGEVRTAVTGMHGGSVLHELEQARKALVSAGLNLHVVGDASIIPEQRDGILAMALREAITNVIRHASAQNCTVTFEQDNTTGTTMTVEDDGTTPALIEEGNGLRGMRARLGAAGGVLDVSTARVGLRVRAHLKGTTQERAIS